MGLLLQGGHVLYFSTPQKMDILIEDQRISKINCHIDPTGHTSVNCSDQWVFPGWIDMHVHLREPGFEEKESIETGTMAAAKGGFTTIACMPNTYPPLDDAHMIQHIHDQTDKTGCVRVLPIGAITQKQRGQVLTSFQAMKQAGIIGLSDDGVGVQSSAVMKAAMINARRCGIPIIAHCEDDTLIGGTVHDGLFAKAHNLKGLPSEAESIHISRDILLAEATGAHYHVCHISSKESVQLVRDAKKRGVHVTAEVTPHHLLLSDEDIPRVDTNYKMNPPLRAPADRQALIEGVLDGTIDIIATDHAPHTTLEKSADMESAPFGIVGLETAFPLLYTHFVKTNILTLRQLIDKITISPADCFGLPSGRLHEGALADLTIVDLEKEKAIDPADFASKGKNTPFSGWTCTGWPTMTIVDGSIKWSEENECH